MLGSEILDGKIYTNKPWLLCLAFLLPAGLAMRLPLQRGKLRVLVFGKVRLVLGK